jgi:iron complex outermembrane receptor protein
MTRNLFVLVTAVWIALASSAAAQTTGSLAGVVRDAQGAVVPGVTVTVTGPSGMRVATTDGQGAYKASALTPGTYQVRFELSGFRTIVKEGVIVAAKAPTTLDVSLEILLVESVTVTAQKREEDLQQVPVAVTALTSAAIENAGVDDVNRLQFITPGLNISRAGEDERPAIRGARTEQVGAVNDPTVGFYVDGIYKSRSSQATNVFVDEERVEVQRGPQGTLFGRNTFGGNIAIYSKLPTDTFDAGANVTLGAYNDRKLDGFLNEPVSDRVQFRVAYDVERRDGYITNTGPAPNLWDEDMNYGRAILRVVPTNNFEVLVRGTFWQQGGNGQGDFGYYNLGTIRDPVTHLISLDGVWDPISPRRGTAGSIPDAGPYSIDRDIPFTRDNHEYAEDIEATWHGQYVNVKSLTGYGKFHSYRQNDGDYSSNVNAWEYTLEDQNSGSEELSVSSVRQKGFSWVAGLFYLHDNLHYRFVFDRMFKDIPSGIPDTASYTSTIPLPPALGLSDGLENDIVSSRAAYAQGTVDIVKNLRATLGARYTDDSKTYTYTNMVTGKYGVGYEGVVEHDVERTWTHGTYHAGLDYELTPTNMLYGSVSTGFTAGGFSFASPQLVYNPQQVIAYEVGSKNQFGPRAQLNISAFHNHFTNLLANAFTTDPVTGAVFTYQTNAGTVNATGVEAELQTAPTDNFKFAVTTAVEDAKYGQFILPNPFPRGQGEYQLLPGNLLNLNGTQVANSPTTRVTVVASYDIHSRYGLFTPLVQMYASSSYTAWDIKIADINVQKAYTRTDLRLMWAPKQARWHVQAYVQNVEGHAILLRALRGGDNFIQATYAEPRTGGVRLSYDFK